MSEAESVLDLAESVAAYLRRKEFTRRPHISLLGADRPTGPTTSLLPEEFFEERIEEQALQRLIPNVTGYRVTLERISEPARIRASYSFYIRVAPPDIPDGKVLTVGEQFRYLKLAFELHDKSGHASLQILDGARQTTVFSEDTLIEIQDGIGIVEIPTKDFKGASNHLATLSLPYTYGMSGEARKFIGAVAAFMHRFSLSLSLAQKDERLELSVHLKNLTPLFIDRKSEKPLKILPTDILDARGDPWTVGILLEFEGLLELQGYKLKTEDRPHGVLGITTINSVLADMPEASLFRDYVIVRETAKKIRLSPNSVERALAAPITEYMKSRGAGADQARIVAEAIPLALEKMGVRFPYTFQETAVKKAFESIQQGGSALAITARTASGKTLVFLIPTVVDALCRRVTGEPEGVKVLPFYPTLALCHDQADTILKFLWHTNLHLKSRGFPFILSMGVLHGKTPSKWYATKEIETAGKTQVERELRYKCPECGSRLILSFLAEEGTIKEKVFCSGSSGRKDCPLRHDSLNADHLTLLNEIIRPSREAIFSAPPDILITTPDTVNIRLFWRPGEQTILGRRVKRCERCKFPTDHLEQRKCQWCGGRLEGPFVFSYPGILIFDEAHQQRGSFGSQVSYVMTRLEEVVKTINGLRKFEPLYIFSSATLRKPDKFIPQFLGRPMKVYHIEAEVEREEEVEPRIHLFVLPKGYSMQATLVHAVRAIFQYYLDKVGRYPNLLVFVNKLSDANELIHLIQDIIKDVIREEFPDAVKQLGQPIVDGHTTDWGVRRAQVEDDFSKGKIHVLIATRGLEVGVDFDRIDALIIYGAPFYVSDYVQRIGRAGRKQPALIVNVCLDKPVDFFFYRQYKVITQASLREKALAAEWINVTRDNSVIRERSIARSILDYLCSRDGAWRYYSETVKGMTGWQNLEFLLSNLFSSSTAKKYIDFYARKEPRKPSSPILNPVLVAYVNNAIGGLTLQEQAFCLRFNEAILSSLEYHPNLGAALLGGELDGIFFLRKLRDTDYDVEVSYEDLRPLSKSMDDWRRARQLGVAVSDYMPAQITSFRRLFFVVDSVEGDLQEGERIKRALQGLPQG